ncbi:MAG TPA: chorismate mutase [Blastocatellia bacterium]|nr:chorismate mutase [Blastocatellia bacterium]
MNRAPTEGRTYTLAGTDLKIEDWRDEIDRLDEQLVKLLNARSQCAIELGRIKRELGLAIYSPDREREVIAHVTGINPGPLDRTAVRRLFERIIDESRRIERVIVEKETKEGNSGKRKKREKS